ncbi:MAG: 30S ribosomal protein S8 [Anaerolineales bacterium]
MSVNDPIADMLTRVRNAIMAHHKTVSIPHSRMKAEIARILKEEGYIKDFEIVNQKPAPVLRLHLKYTQDKQPVLTGLKRVSSPGRRVYTSRADIPWVLSGMGIAILSTPKGIMTGQKARRLGVGGEILCYVW